MSILIFNSSNRAYLDSINIHTIFLLAKLAYWYLELYIVEK